VRAVSSFSIAGIYVRGKKIRKNKKTKRLQEMTDNPEERKKLPR
jgi:hypothetical protein